MVNTSWVEPRYSCFRPYKLLLTESSKNLTFILKNSPNILYSTQYLTRGWVTRPWSINFTFRLRLDLDHRLLVFSLTTNLESGPRFADICWKGLFINGLVYVAWKPVLGTKKSLFFKKRTISKNEINGARVHVRTCARREADLIPGPSKHNAKSML